MTKLIILSIGCSIFGFVKHRLESIGPSIWKEVNVIWGIEEEVQKFKRTFFKVYDLVEHVKSNPMRLHGGSSAWKLYFEDLRKIAYDADAILDQISLHLSIYCAHYSITANQNTQVFSMILSSFRTLNLPHKISKMQIKLDGILKEIENLIVVEKGQFDPRGKLPEVSVSNLNSTSSLVVTGKSVFGRETEKEGMLGFLRRCDNSHFSVFCAMGMSGIGKTAVANNVYCDGRINFNLKIWVSVSVGFDVSRITKSMIEYATLAPCNLSDLPSLQRVLENILYCKKFLLVLDDYWSENCDEWDALSGPFRVGARGSKVIVTTRSKKVSSVVCSSDECELDILSDADCWELIKERAMLTDESTIQSLESIGMEIAMKCKGVPLIAAALGNMLRGKMKKGEWHPILKNEVWDILEDHCDVVFLRLMHSYIHLPSHLQKCFAYCSLFPQDHEFEMEELVLLWVAEGFVQPRGAEKLEVEDLAQGYFNDLLSKFFFKQCETASNHQVTYKMHSFIHGMARLISRDICFHLKHDASCCYPLFGTSCHFSLLNDSQQPLLLKGSIQNSRLRTFILMSIDPVSTEIDSKLFSHLKFLKVLGLSGAKLTMLEESISKLEYLRYLNLSDNPIAKLPLSMCSLLLLQILKLRNCPNLTELPKHMSRLTNLRHVVLDEENIQHMPPEFGRLTQLQHLSVYVISKDSGCGIVELKELNRLRRSLHIRNIEVVSASEASDAQLGMKTL